VEGESGKTPPKRIQEGAILTRRGNIPSPENRTAEKLAKGGGCRAVAHWRGLWRKGRQLLLGPSTVPPHQKPRKYSAGQKTLKMSNNRVMGKKKKGIQRF